MIVKSLGRKERCFGKLARYIDNGAEQGIVISRNLSVESSDRAAVVAAFEANADYLSPRRRGNWCYHDIIALPEHAGGLADTEVMLRDLAETYLSFRAPDQLAYGRLHIKTPKPHIHLMISANTVASPRRARLSRQAFQAARLQLENYKLERWPKLAELPAPSSINAFSYGAMYPHIQQLRGKDKSPWPEFALHFMSDDVSLIQAVTDYLGQHDQAGRDHFVASLDPVDLGKATEQIYNLEVLSEPAKDGLISMIGDHARERFKEEFQQEIDLGKPMRRIDHADVVELIATGKNQLEVAAVLGIDRSTVSTICRKVF